MSRKLLKPLVAAVVLTATIAAFIIYFQKNPDTLHRLADIPLSTLAVIFGLYYIFMVTLIWIQRATLLLCDIHLERKESRLLVMYSSIVNFFGPLQSGPGFRAAYLKAKHNVSLKKYTGATLMYYGFYAFFSGILLLSAFASWWAVAGCLVLVAVLPFSSRVKQFRGFSMRSIGLLALASLAQVMIMTVIYFMELRSLDSGVSYLQVLSYTGAANLALFVSLTPGAIGFRESFLLFSQNLHGINSANIVTASLIDRGAYVLMLLAAAVIVFTMHANTIFKPKPKTNDSK